MENQLDSESYWNRSASKAFSFDDDDEFDGPTATNNKPEIGTVLNDDTISEASFNSIVGSTLSLSINSVISKEALLVLLDEQTLDDRIITKGVTAEEELKQLRRQIQTQLYNPSPEATAHKLLLGKNVTLEAFKSFDEKQQLLDAVLKIGGGDAIIDVVLFLRKSLNKENFYKILQERPVAFQHYLSFLKQRHSNEAIELLQHFYRHQEAALLQFKDALSCQHLQMRKQKLRLLLERYGNDAAVVASAYQQYFHTTLKLLELIEKESAVLDTAVDLDATPIEILYACCRKHNNWKEQEMQRATSPFRLCTEQQISAAQFEWTALNERSSSQAYADLESVFERYSTWHPLKHKQFHISFPLELAVLRLYKLQAPPTVLYLFLSKMNNTAEKLNLAERVKCTKASIDSLVGLKDVARLTALMEALPARSEEQFYCDKGLKSLQTKRWTTDNIKLKL